MAFLPSIFRNAIAFFVPSRPDPKPNPRKLSGITNDPRAEHGYEPSPRRRKRSGSEEPSEVITKRRRVNQTQYAPIVDGETFESTNISGNTNPLDPDEINYAKAETDRALMPPPSLTPLKVKTLNGIDYVRSDTKNSMEPDSASQASFATRSTRLRHGDNVDEYDMERARRHAAATTLPANSGVWERGEKELFYHLAYRGFEPLLPASWMRDFPTLPLSLYATEDEHVPLIQAQQKREFRAIRELRELLDLGKGVRDKVLSSPGANREAVIEKATTKYISWALNDVGIKISSLSNPIKEATSKAIPIHVIITLKRGQSTTDCLFELKNKLHALAARHRQSRNIYTSVEQDEINENPDNVETCLAESNTDDLPVLYGIMICRSILAIFTMNSQTPPPMVIRDGCGVNSLPLKSNGTIRTSTFSKSSRNMLTMGRNENGKIVDDDPDDTASDPRFISDFDFSDPARDVWNALVIAIVAMQIRADMVILRGGYDQDEDGQAELANDDISGLEAEDDDDDDPDA